MSTTVTYKGETLTTVSNETVVLETEGTWVEDDFTLTDTTSGGTMQAKSNIDPTTSSQTIEPDEGYDGLSSVQINAMPTGTAGTPTATKGAVSNHSISVTPSVTNSAGYIASGTINGTAVSVSASELDSGAKSITANGNSQDVVGYASVNVNVPNTYAAGDEGKVVSSGALVSQTAHADVTPTTSDQTIDTTTNNSIKVKGDANLVAGNIKKDVEIFGTTGSYEGGGGGLSVDDIIERTNFPATITYDGTKKPTDYVFMNCTTIQSFTASKKMDLAPGVFYGCTGLQSASLPLCETNNQSCGNVFQGCTSLTSVYLPKVKLLGGSSFRSCSSLETLVLPSVTALRTDYARDTALKKIDLGACTSIPTANTLVNNPSLTMIVLRASSVCTLSNINVLNNTPFASGGTGGTLYVPNSLLASYQSASNWSTLLGYTNNQIKSIESTHTDPNAPIDLTLYYADGTVIPT